MFLIFKNILKLAGFAINNILINLNDKLIY